MMRLRNALVPFAAVVSLFLGGCGTYLQQKADVIGGGPERRVKDAQERRQAAEDTQRGLQSDQEALLEERAIQEKQLSDLNRRLEAQEEKIARAREENRITRAREQEMREEIRALDGEIREVEFQLDAARISGDARRKEALRKQLQDLQKKMDTLDEEIEVMSE